MLNLKMSFWHGFKNVTIKNRFRSQFQKAKESCTKVENVEFEGRRVNESNSSSFTTLYYVVSFLHNFN